MPSLNSTSIYAKLYPTFKYSQVASANFKWWHFCTGVLLKTFSYSGPLPRSRKQRLKDTGLTDQQFDVGNLWRHLLRCSWIQKKFKQSVRDGLSLSLNSMRKLWHCHLNTLKRALSYSTEQLRQASIMLSRGEILRAVEILSLGTGPELPIMRRLRGQIGVVQAFNGSVLSIYGVVTPCGMHSPGQTTDGIREGQGQNSPPSSDQLILPSGSNTGLVSQPQKGSSSGDVSPSSNYLIGHRPVPAPRGTGSKLPKRPSRQSKFSDYLIYRWECIKQQIDPGKWSERKQRRKKKDHG